MRGIQISVIGLILAMMFSPTLTFPQKETIFDKPETKMMGLEEGKFVEGFKNHDQLAKVESCADALYVMAFTSGVSYAGSDDSPYVTIELTTNEKESRRLYDRNGDDMYPNKGDIWKLQINEFGFGESCITKSDIRWVSISEGGDDGWNIESIVTGLYNYGTFTVLTADFNVYQWVDGDGSYDEREVFLTNV